MGMDFKKIYQFVDQMEVTADLLEIGTDRGEDSTGVLAEIAAKNNKVLYSVDMDEQLINNNRNKYSDMPVKFYPLKGEDFLDQNSELKFSVALLDNFDWNWWTNDTVKPDFLGHQQESYKSVYNLEMTNNNCQIAHLKQAMKLTTMLTPRAIVICDDTFLSPHNTYDGKCGAAIPYLMTLGFEPIEVGCGFVLSRL